MNRSPRFRRNSFEVGAKCVHLKVKTVPLGIELPTSTFNHRKETTMRIKPNALHAAFVVLTIVSANAFAVDVTAGDGSTVHDRYGAAVTDRYNAPAQTTPAGDDAAVPSQAAAPAPEQPKATTQAKREKARARAAQGPYEVDGETLFEFNSTPFDAPATR